MWWSATISYKEFTLEGACLSKSTTQHSQYIVLLWHVLSLLSVLPTYSTTSTTCGGTYRAPRGVIQTPDFPHQFQTPIDCEWVIDASHSDHCTYAKNESSAEKDASTIGGTGNYRIIIYFTQVYVLRGLSFTEYYNYSNTKNVVEGNAAEDGAVYNYGEEKIEVDPFTTYYVQSCANFLVIRLHLDSVVGTHVRVLNNFLDVYGFNVTYEISTVIRKNMCKMSSCGFTGYCYDNFETFFCDCLPGFKSPYCSDGPKSLCVKNGVHICKNNRTCKLMGETAHTCEKIQVNSREMVFRKSFKTNKGCDNCRISCPFNGIHKGICDCSKSLRKVHNPKDVGYSANLILRNITALNMSTLMVEHYLHEGIPQTLGICNALTNNKTIKFNYIDNDVHVYFHVPSVRDEMHKLENCFRKVLDYSFGVFTLLEKEVTLNLEPSLFLERLSINKKLLKKGVIEPILEGQEFILTCMAVGSPNMVFRWYKDNMFINITTPTKSNKWIQLARKDTNNNNEWGAYWSILVVSGAQELDDGWFTCQVVDDDRQQCASQRVDVTVVPTVFIEPMSLTVKQGEPFGMICRDSSRSSKSDNCHFSWLENDKPLLNNAESLYPKGSYLKIPGINTTTTYSCTKACIAERIIKEATITVYVYDSSKEILCKADNTTKNLVHWPDTAPNAVSIVGCPENYTGFVSRMCATSNQTNSDGSDKFTAIGAWGEPDYSGCLHDELDFIKRNFEKLKLAYDYTTALRIINGYKRYVISMDGHILSSEGKRIFMLLDDILTYIINSSNLRSIPKITNVILNVTDVLLSNTKAIYTKNDIIYMQRVVKTVLLLFAKANGTYEFTWREFNITVSNSCNDKTSEKKNEENVLCIHYFNLSPKISKFVDCNALMQLQLISDIRSVFVLNGNVEEANELTVSVKITDWAKLNHLNNDVHYEWRAQCVVSNWGFDWNENVCSTFIDMHRHMARCRCGTDGTFAVAYVKISKIIYESIETNKLLVPSLYAISLLLSLGSVIISLIEFRSSKTAVSFMQCHGSLSKIVICGIFALGACTKFEQESYLHILSTILICYLLALSSQFAILMITYSELEDFLQKEIAKAAVVEIFIVGLVLVTIGNHIAHVTVTLRQPSWWLKMADNLSFNVFIICLVVIILLFVLLYWILWNFIRKEINLGCMFVYKKYNRIKKCSYLFCAFLINVTAGIFYINYEDNIILQYVLIFTFILIDVTTLLCNTNYRRFYIKQIVSKMRKTSSKGNAARSLKSIYRSKQTNPHTWNDRVY